jgi:hypothetical protein
MGTKPTEEDSSMYEEVIRLIKKIRDNPDTWMTFHYPDPELMNNIAAIVLEGWHR